MSNRKMCPICEEQCWSEEFDDVATDYKCASFNCRRIGGLFYLDYQLIKIGNQNIGQFYYTQIVNDLLSRKNRDPRFPHYCLGPVPEIDSVRDVFVNVTRPQWYQNHIEKIDRSLLNIYRLFGEKAFNLGTTMGMRCILCIDDKERLAMENSLIDFGYISKTNSLNDSERYIISREGWKRISELFQKSSDRIGFIAISFSDKTKNIRDTLKKCISECGFEPIIINEVEHNNQIVPEIKKNIQKCRFLVMDCSEPNLGAYYEAGMAVGYEKEVIICCNREKFKRKNTRPHFDIAQQSMVLWDNLEQLEMKLKERILCTVEGAYEHKTEIFNDPD